MLNNIVTLKCGFRGHLRSFKLVPFESLGAFSYSLSIVTMAISFIICEIKRHIGRKSWFFHTPLHSTPSLGGGGVPSVYFHPVWCVKHVEWWGYPMVKNFEDIHNRLDTIPACDRQTDRQTSCHGIVRAMHTRRAVKKFQFNNSVNFQNYLTNFSRLWSNYSALFSASCV